MTNINLSQPMRQGPIKKASALDKGVYTSLAILAITLLIFGGLKLWTSRLQSERGIVEGQIAAESRGLEGAEIDQVADFNERVLKIGENLAAERNPNEVLGEVEKSVVPGSVITSLSSSGGVISLKVATDNFLVAAKQLLSLKKSNYFSNVKITEISRDTQGKVVLSLEVRL